jgi:gluconokinase
MSQLKNTTFPFVLALDVGTSSTRALLFDASGAAVPDMISQRTYKLTISADGEVSVDAEMLATVVEETIDEILRLAGPAARQIGAVALDTFWHSLLGVDASDRPLTPLITWEDTRPRDAVYELRAQFAEPTVHARTGVHFHASYWPAKLLWFSHSQPEVCAQVTQWISFGEYLHRRFLGRSVCSLSMASATGMLNISTRQWDTELMQVLKIAPEKLPALGDMRDHTSGLQGKYATAWPVLRNVPWFPALGDGASACIGSGCIDDTCWSLTMGTSSALRVVIEPGQVVPPSGLWHYFIDGKRAVLGGALSEGGNLLNWLCDTLKLPALKEAEPLIASLAPDSHQLTILPFISGERSLGWHSEARLTVSGLARDSTPAEILRAGYESLAYRLLALHELLCTTLDHAPDQHQLQASGGVLLGSALIKSVLADTLGVAIYPSQEQEASARGAALLALEALGVIPNLAEVAPVLQEPILPNKGHREAYRKGAERQQHLYQALMVDRMH